MKAARMFLWIILFAAIFVILLSLLLFFVQGRMIYHPGRHLSVTPDELGLNYEDVFIEVDDHSKIHAWYFPADGDGPTVLFCHGNAGNISHRLETVHFLLTQGASVLLFDYRGYGRSDGSASEQHTYEDAEAAYRWLVGPKGAGNGDIVIMGRSLGGAVAIDLASRVPCRGLIIESAFTSIEDMGRRMFPFLPINLLLRYHYNSERKIAGLDCPVMVAHSPSDEVIPYEMGVRLFRAAKEPKVFVELTGGHNDRAYFEDPAYVKALHNTLDGTVSGADAER